VGEKVQLTAREEPKMRPKPLATLQVSTPAFKPCACAGASNAKAPAAKLSALIITPSFLSISYQPLLFLRRAVTHGGCRKIVLLWDPQQQRDRGNRRLLL